MFKDIFEPETYIIKCMSRTPMSQFRTGILADNDKSLFSKLRPLLRHIRDISIYKYNNNYSEKSTIRWKNSNATNIQIIIKYKFFYMGAHYYGIFPY